MSRAFFIFAVIVAVAAAAPAGTAATERRLEETLTFAEEVTALTTKLFAEVRALAETYLRTVVAAIPEWAMTIYNFFLQLLQNGQ